MGPPRPPSTSLVGACGTGSRLLQLPVCQGDNLLNVVHSTHAGLDVTADWTGGASVPIGKPIDNTSCYILDTQLQLLPLGLPGELMVSGVQARRGPVPRPSAHRHRHLLPQPQAPATLLNMLLACGAQVSRGYLKRPELTAEKFIPNPYVAGRPLHSRLYRTGDP